MSMSKYERLERILESLVTKSHKGITNCVVINERGLIVASKVLDESSNETFAAMVSLMSDTSLRICNNLDYENPRTTIVRTPSFLVAVNEFLVMKRRFRIGTVFIEKENRKFSLCRGRLFVEKRLKMEKIEDLLIKTTQDIRAVLEGR